MPSVTDPDKEVDHEEYVECEIKLLSCILRPGHAGLNSVTKHIGDIEMNIFTFPYLSTPTLKHQWSRWRGWRWRVWRPVSPGSSLCLSGQRSVPRPSPWPRTWSPLQIQSRHRPGASCHRPASSSLSAGCTLFQSKMDPSYNGLEILNDFVLRCYLLLTVIEGFLQNWIQTKYLLLISHCELSSKQKQIDSLASDLSAEHGCECSDEKDGEDSHEECADGGEKEAPPLPGPQTVLLTQLVPFRPLHGDHLPSAARSDPVALTV